MTLIGVGIIIKTNNVIHAAYALGLVLISLAGIYVLLNAELLAVVQILLYAGGVVILLIFGVMMTNRKSDEGLNVKSQHVFLASLLSISILFVFTYLFSGISVEKQDEASVNQIHEIGLAFLTDHIVAFELIAFILLVALVGASYLAKVSSDE
jgi:NADH-quinone oxidoreductase subunit J